ncbi:hypothetical protein SAMN06272737_12867 [Blastococcus mobilis]|uniref:Uncharacterized protein n=1 Tax=Blastococcus mobilis TaxID=1938746 RepID=A0A238ZH39_9ACTN|nr:hypothetical protein SAMN06272737_12867 [Blastococcus mobilis]
MPPVSGRWSVRRGPRCARAQRHHIADDPHRRRADFLGGEGGRYPGEGGPSEPLAGNRPVADDGDRGLGRPAVLDLVYCPDRLVNRVIGQVQAEQRGGLLRGDPVGRSRAGAVFTCPVGGGLPLVGLHAHRLHRLGSDVPGDGADAEIGKGCGRTAHRPFPFLWRRTVRTASGVSAASARVAASAVHRRLAEASAPTAPEPDTSRAVWPRQYKTGSASSARSPRPPRPGLWSGSVTRSSWWACRCGTVRRRCAGPRSSSGRAPRCRRRRRRSSRP